MEGNPYVNLIAALREDTTERTPTHLRLGKVISISPLKVEISGTVQEREQILLNNSLYQGNENIKLKRTSDGVETEYHAPSRLKIQAGDTVLVLPMEEEQKFILICKVV